MGSMDLSGSWNSSFEAINKIFLNDIDKLPLSQEEKDVARLEIRDYKMTVIRDVAKIMESESDPDERRCMMGEAMKGYVKAGRSCVKFLEEIATITPVASDAALAQALARAA